MNVLEFFALMAFGLLLVWGISFFLQREKTGARMASIRVRSNPYDKRPARQEPEEFSGEERGLLFLLFLLSLLVIVQLAQSH